MYHDIKNLLSRTSNYDIIIIDFELSITIMNFKKLAVMYYLFTNSWFKGGANIYIAINVIDVYEMDHLT